MEKWTVVGRYDDNGQIYVGFLTADGPEEAARAALIDNIELDEVLCVFAGEHQDRIAEFLEADESFR